MRRIIDSDLLTLISRFFIGAVFIYASWYKILDPGAFARSIYFYHILPGDLINIAALVMSWMEFIVGVCLILGVWYRGAVVWANLFMALFIVALGSAIARNLSIDCGCFKAASSATDSAWHALKVDLIYMVFCLQLLASRSRRWQVGTRRRRR